jgi:hypothetical protein
MEEIFHIRLGHPPDKVVPVHVVEERIAVTDLGGLAVRRQLRLLA